MAVFDKSWLKRRTSLDELPVDWGLIQAEWDALRSKMIDGDEFWEFAHGQALACQAGIALKRGDRIVGYIVTIQS